MLAHTCEHNTKAKECVFGDYESQLLFSSCQTFDMDAAIESHSRGQKGSDLREIASNQDGYIQNSAACVLYFDEISQGV